MNTINMLSVYAAALVLLVVGVSAQDTTQSAVDVELDESYLTVRQCQ
jgi:hypothetical protein